MMDHRLIQRTLFRMQLDSNFANQIRERNAAALSTTGLEADDLEWLISADWIAVSADPGGRRLSQLIGNVVAEYACSVSLAVDELGMTDVAAAFASSPEFHVAISCDRSLPIEFGGYLARRFGEREDRPIDSVLAYERVMVDARRAPRTAPVPACGEVVLAGSARIIGLKSNTFDRVRAFREDGSTASSVKGTGIRSVREKLLITTGERPHPGALHAVDVEVLSDSVAEILSLAEKPLGPADRAKLAEKRDVEPEELDDFFRGLIAEGLLVGSL